MPGLLKLSVQTVLKLAVWVMTGLVLFACLFLARILYAPLDLKFATEVIEERASAFLPGWNISYETAKIGWDWRSVKPWITIDNIELIDRRDRLQAEVPQVRVDVSFASLFTSAGISTIQVERPSVNITDLAGFSDATDDSSLADFFDLNGPPRPEVFRPITEAFSRFTARLLRNAPHLDGIYFYNTAVEIARGEDTPDLSVTMPAFRLDHARARVQLSAQVDAEIAGQLTRVTLSGQAEPDIGELFVDVALRDVAIAPLTRDAGLPEFFSYLNFPVGLDLQLDLSSNVGLRGAAFELTIGEGDLFHPVAFPDRSTVNYGVVSGALNVAEDQIVVEEISLQLGTNHVDGDGLVYWEEGYDRAGLKLQLSLAETSVEEVKKYWPIKLHPDGRPRGARAWVDDHMLAGTPENVVFDLDMKPDGSTPFANGSPFQLSFDVRDVDTLYVKTMPALRGVNGRAVLTTQTFDVFINSGTVMDMPVGGSVAHMSDIHIRNGAKGDFDILLEGNLRRILDLIDRKPVEISNKIAMDLDRIDGTARVEAKLSLPLLKKVPKEAVLYDVTAYVKSGEVDDILKGEGLRGADVTLTVNGDELTASGFGDVNGVPMELYWREDFAGGRTNPEADTTTLVMSGSADAADLYALGVDVRQYLEGKALAEATFLGRNLEFRVGYFSADASEATLKEPAVGWVKPPYAPASINGTIIFDGEVTKLEPMSVTGDELDLLANFTFGASGARSYEGKVVANKLGRNKMNATISKEANGPVKVLASAEVFDLEPLLKPLSAEKQGEQKNSAELTEETEDSGFDLLMHANKIHLQNGESYSNADVKLQFESGEPILLDFKSEEDGIVTDMRISDTEEVLRPFYIETGDAGKLLRGFGLFAHMEGGTLSLSAETDRWGNELKLAGAMAVRDTRLVTKDSLGEEVIEGVISGLDEYLDGGSIDLNVVDVPFNYEKGLLDLSGLKANGPSLGMTMEGQIQTAEGKINVNGVVVPAYGLNSLLGKIPLLGAILTGGSGKGIFGVTYRVKGSTEAPDVSVNPLSGLAPGFLRILFEGRKGKVEDVEIVEEQKEESGEKEPGEEKGGN